MTEFPILVVLAAGFSLGGTWLAARVLRARGIVDVPNDRSMHRTPTPRGGGLPFVAFTLGFAAWAWWTGRLDPLLAEVLLVGGLLVAAVGLLDDRFTLNNRVRVAAWVPLAAWVSWRVGGLPVLDLGTFSVPLGLAGHLFVVVAITWMVNLYNFMDGIDGLAGAEAALVSFAATALLLLNGDLATAQLAAVVGAGAAGFLVWNWSPARIFMGDVGSGFLGYVFAILALFTERAGTVPAGVWGILLGVFLVDATLTVLWRAYRGEAWWRAHRNHAYQRAVRGGRSHRDVVLAVIGINLLLAGLALAAYSAPPLLLPTGLAALALVAGIWYAVPRQPYTGREEAQALPTPKQERF